MEPVSSLTLVKRAYDRGYAVPSFCTWSSDSMDVVLRTAERLKAPVLLMQGPDELPLLAPGQMAAVARSLIESRGVPAAIHLDHGNSLAMVRDCVQAGYTSVMLDYSARPLEENISALTEVVAIARPGGITVEGEVGKVGKADDPAIEGEPDNSLTDPAAAERFWKETEVDMLAVSIGNKHGFYKGDPNLDFELLATLHSVVKAPLVLHGGTGIPASHLEKAIGLGMAKVNIASEFVHGYRQSLTEQWSRGERLWGPLAFEHAKNAMEQVIEKWIRLTGAAGQA